MGLFETRRASVGTHYCASGHLSLETYSYERRLWIDLADKLCIFGSSGGGYLELEFEYIDELVYYRNLPKTNVWAWAQLTCTGPNLSFVRWRMKFNINIRYETSVEEIGMENEFDRAGLPDFTRTKTKPEVGDAERG